MDNHAEEVAALWRESQRLLAKYPGDNEMRNEAFAVVLTWENGDNINALPQCIARMKAIASKRLGDASE